MNRQHRGVGAVVILSLTLVALATGATLNAACPDLVGRWSSGPVRAVDVDATTLVFGRGSELVIADITAPAATVEIARLQLEGIPHDLAIMGTIVLVAADEAGLVLVDIADPAHPVARAMLPTGVHAEGVAFAGDRAYVVDPWSGLHVIDVADPANPVDLGSIDTTGYPFGVAVAGDHAFLAADSGGMVVVDISDPTDPRELAALPIWGGADAVTVVDNVAYVAAGSNGLVLVDVTDPVAPTEVGQWGTTSIARDVAVRDGLAYLAGEGGGLHVVDVTNPSQPLDVGSIDTPGWAAAVAVTVGTGIACVADDFAGLAVVDLAAEDIVATLPGAGESVGVAVGSGHSWVTDEAGFLRVLDVTDPAQPYELSALATDATLGDLIVLGDRAYLASPDGRLLVYDVIGGGQPTLLTSIEVPGRPENLVSSGDVLYLAAMNGGLRIFDISDPDEPHEVGVYMAPDDVRDVAVLGVYAYVAVQGNGLRVVDVSNPSTPFEVGAVTDEPIAVGVAAAPGYAYLGAHYGGMRIIDVSDPTAPVDIAGIGSPGGAGDVAVAGDLVFFEEGQSGLVVVDVSDPHNPATVGSYDTPGNIRHVRVAGDRLYVADDAAGVESFEAVGCTGGSPIAAFTWSPDSPEVGEVVQFTDLSTELPTSWAWQFGDGVSASTQHPTHAYQAAGTMTVSLTATNSHGSDTTTRTLAVRAAPVVPPITDPGDHVTVVPAAANAPGVAGTSWVTDMVLHNPGTTDATANLYYMVADADNTGAVGHQVEVAAGSSLRLADVVASVFAATGTGGAILVGCDHELLVSSRTFNNAATGTYGQYIPAVPASTAWGSDAAPRLIQLAHAQRADTGFRTNIGAVNTTAGEIVVTVELFRGNGDRLGEVPMTLPPYAYHQENDILRAGADLPDAFAIVRSATPGAGYLCYASVVDNRSGDPVYIPGR